MQQWKPKMALVILTPDAQMPFAMITRNFKTITLFLLLCFCYGCSTLAQHRQIGYVKPAKRCAAQQQYLTYSGTIQDSLFVIAGARSLFTKVGESEPDYRALGVLIGVVGVVDFPLSLTADTVLLPATVPLDFWRKYSCTKSSIAT